MSKISEKRALKLKAMEEKNTSLQAVLTDSQSKVRRVEDQRTIFSNKLIIACLDDRLLQQSQKVEAELVNLRKQMQVRTFEKKILLEN